MSRPQSLDPTLTPRPERTTRISAPVGRYAFEDGALHRQVRRAPRVRFSKLTIAAGDGALIALAVVVSLELKLRYVPGDLVPADRYLVAGLASVPLWLVALASRRLYQARFTGRRLEELRRLLEGSTIAVVALIVADFGLQLELARTWVALVGVIAVAVLAVYREVVRQVFRSRHRRGVGLRRVVIVGDNDEALSIEQMLRTDHAIGYEVVGRVVQRSGSNTGEVGSMLLDDTIRAVEDSGAQGVIIAVTSLDATLCNQLVRALAYSGVHLELSSALSDISADRLSLRPMGRVPVVYIEPVNHFGWRPIAKRAFDVTASAFALVALVPLFAVVAAAVKVTSPGPVLFRQERLGRDGRLFSLVKFRSMVADAEQHLDELRARNEADGPLFKVRDDPRVTRFGRFLRRSSIDELPQLWNVLAGDMSLVGPRPALPSESEQWSSDLFGRLRVRPGITGMWQVSGRSEASFDDYTRLDLYYVDNWSLIVDMTILAKTVPAVVARRGAS